MYSLISDQVSFPVVFVTLAAAATYRAFDSRFRMLYSWRSSKSRSF